MLEPVVGVVGDMSRAERVARAWPGEGGVALRAWTEGDAGVGAVLVIDSQAKLDAHRRLVQELCAAGVGCVVLTSDVRAWVGLAGDGRGALVLAEEISDVGAACALAACCARQEAVQALSRDLALAVRCQAGTAAEVARMHEELHLAASLQHDFTSAPMPRVPGFDVGAIYRPVSAVSGDIFSVRMLDAHTAAFFIADAVGHGVPAALLTMVLTACLAGEGWQQRMRDPRGVITMLNQRLVEGGLCHGRFATALAGTLDTRTRSVTLCGAGHPHGVVLGRTGVRTLETEGPLLGVFPDADFTVATDTLREGEALAVYTDGLEAALRTMDEGARGGVRAGAQAGARVGAPVVAKLGAHLDALRGALAATAWSVGDALGELEGTIDEQAGSLHQEDDITILAMRARAA